MIFLLIIISCNHNPKTFEAYSLQGSWEIIEQVGDTLTFNRVEQLDPTIYGFQIFEDFTCLENVLTGPCDEDMLYDAQPGTWNWLDDNSINMNVETWGDNINRIMVILNLDGQTLQVRYVHEEWQGPFPFIYDLVCGKWVQIGGQNNLRHLVRRNDWDVYSYGIEFDYSGTLIENQPIGEADQKSYTKLIFNGNWITTGDSTITTLSTQGLYASSKDIKIVSVSDTDLYILADEDLTFVNSGETIPIEGVWRLFDSEIPVQYYVRDEDPSTDEFYWGLDQDFTGIMNYHYFEETYYLLPLNWFWTTSSFVIIEVDYFNEGYVLYDLEIVEFLGDTLIVDLDYIGISNF